MFAVTGGTGFVGSHLIDRARATSHEIRALTRRARPDRAGVTWIEGALDRPETLSSLMQNADAVIHVAGVVNAPGRAGFVAGNIDGTRAIVSAAEAAGVRRFVHVSSLSAREPQLSDYGWSKAEAEHLVEASGLDWTIVRPTGVYGPGDTEMRDIFRLAARGLALLPPPGKLSVIAVDDLAALLLTLAEQGGLCTIYEVDDGTSYTHAEFARAVGKAVGHRVLPIHLPRPILKLGAALDRTFRGTGAKLTADRIGYLCHPDWTARAECRPPVSLWTPVTATPDGLAATAAWYRAHGLL